MKRFVQISNLSLALGIALLSYAVAGYARTSIRQSDLKAEWDERSLAGWQATETGEASVLQSVERPVLPGPEDETVSSAKRWPDGTPLREGDPVARMRIPRIGVDAVVLEGVSDKTLSVAPGHYPGTALPGEGGHVVVSAHRDSFFKDVGQLERGDLISVTRLDGRKLIYRISRTYIVHRTNRTVIVAKDGELLTLITCYPFIYVGHAPYRYILEAVPADGGLPTAQSAG